MRNTNLIRQLIHVFEKDPRTRGNDRLLMTVYYEEFFPHEFENGFMKPNALTRMTNPDDIVRLRAIIQNTMGIFLPKDPETRKKRRQSAEQWKKWTSVSRNKIAIQSLLEFQK